jgi:hypothetical protein
VTRSDDAARAIGGWRAVSRPRRGQPARRERLICVRLASLGGGGIPVRHHVHHSLIHPLLSVPRHAARRVLGTSVLPTFNDGGHSLAPSCFPSLGKRRRAEEERPGRNRPHSRSRRRSCVASSRGSLRRQYSALRPRLLAAGPASSTTIPPSGDLASSNTEKLTSAGLVQPTSARGNSIEQANRRAARDHRGRRRRARRGALRQA